MKTEILDQLDQLLEDYLTLLDSYQTVQASLQSNLKQGYFNLAKSKLALGPDRLSQKNWDLKQKESLVEVLIDSQQVEDDTTTIREKDQEQQSSSNLNWSLQPRASPLTPSVPSLVESTPSTLRQRNTTTTATITKSTGMTKAETPLPPPPTSLSEPKSKSIDSLPDSSPTASHRIPSPLSQFSAFPPPPLRSAAKDFETVLSEVVKVVEIERKLRILGKEIKGVKKRIKLVERDVDPED
ncbi:hypothetical protein JCM5350_001623 [Sporobolomyces pararoseus]